MNRYISIEDYIEAEKTALDKNISIKQTIEAKGGDIEILDKRKVIKLVNPRSPNGHKGTFGKLVAIVGSDRYPGAAQISSLAALRSGIGLLQVVTTKSSAISLSSAIKEATLLPLDSDEDGFIVSSEKALQEIGDAISNATAILIGCGLGNNLSTLEILEFIIENAKCPIIIDADGINALASRIELLRKAKTDIILTPHPAELSRLCGVSASEAIANRHQCAKKLSEEYRVTVVAKSASTLITSPDYSCLSLYGNDGLAKGGSGDMLAGLISSFAAQGYDSLTASKLGVVIMGLCCERVSKKHSRSSMLASDVINSLPSLFKKFERLG